MHPESTRSDILMTVTMTMIYTSNLCINLVTFMEEKKLNFDLDLDLESRSS